MLRDLIVIGAGAAGLSAAAAGARAGLKTLLLEQTAAGGQCLLSEALESCPGLAEPVGGYDFAARLEEQARGFGAEYRLGTVTRIRGRLGGFVLEIESGEAERCATVILATGARQRTLGVPGESELTGRGVSWCAACDGPFFREGTVAVVGGGEAACAEALFLETLARRVIVVHRRDRLRARGIPAERLLANERVRVRFRTAVRAIESRPGPAGFDRVGAVLLEDCESGDLTRETVDALFVCIGSQPRTGLVPGLATGGDGGLVTDAYMETDLPGLFAAGAVRSGPSRRIAVAVAEGMVAAESAARRVDELADCVYPRGPG